MNNFNSEMWISVTTIFVAIIGVASLAVFFGRNSQTSNVIKSSFGGLSQSLQAAEAPVLGGGGQTQALMPLYSPNTNFYGAPLTDGFAY